MSITVLSFGKNGNLPYEPRVIVLTACYSRKYHVSGIYGVKAHAPRTPSSRGAFPSRVLTAKTAGGELVAAAIKRNKRAELVGHKTSGKVQAKKEVKHDNGSSELVVSAEYYLNRKTPITGRGVGPDIRMAADASPQEVLEKAIEVLEGEINEK